MHAMSDAAEQSRHDIESKAERCRQRAEQSRDERTRTHWLNMEKFWRNLLVRDDESVAEDRRVVEV
jgi:hypothetical protein